MELKRLGCEGTIDILDRESKGSNHRDGRGSKRREEAQEGKRIADISVSEKTVYKTEIRTEDVKAVVSCTFPESQALTESASSR
jgi:hypothetical protein